jgi:hypothetical protein
MGDVDRAAEEQFLERLTDHYQPDTGRGTPRSALRASINVFVKRARTLGMTEQAAIAAFVGLGLEFGPFFDYHPEIRRVLGDTSIDPNLRVELLPDLVPENVWAEMPDFHERAAEQLERRAGSS